MKGLDKKELLRKKQEQDILEKELYDDIDVENEGDDDVIISGGELSNKIGNNVSTIKDLLAPSGIDASQPNHLEIVSHVSRYAECVLSQIF